MSAGSAAPAPTVTSPRRRFALHIPSVSPAAAFGIRFGVGAGAAIWLGHVSGLVTNSSSAILITVLVVMQPVTGGSFARGLLRVVGTLAAAVTAILLFGLYAQDPPLLLAGLFLTQAIGVYGFTGPRHQYAWFVWAFTLALVLGGAMEGTHAVETVAFQRASMILLGILIIFVVDSLFWPQRSEATFT